MAQLGHPASAAVDNIPDLDIIKNAVISAREAVVKAASRLRELGDRVYGGEPEPSVPPNGPRPVPAGALSEVREQLSGLDDDLQMLARRIDRFSSLA